eukprot:m.41490 g.41490  ORF g.41490 m.41490 type:complete len:70 (-) comp12837_c0_seq1:1018-1227(-)
MLLMELVMKGVCCCPVSIPSTYNKRAMVNKAQHNNDLQGVRGVAGSSKDGVTPSSFLALSAVICIGSGG